MRAMLRYNSAVGILGYQKRRQIASYRHEYVCVANVNQRSILVLSDFFASALRG